MTAAPVRRACASVLALVLAAVLAVPALVQTRVSFAARIAELSEPGGYFDTDNLISNERSYLEVMPALDRVPQGGAYLGVGPEQNFSYIAATRPAVAYLVDIRRDNLLLHLLFKALFTLAETRVEYLSLLFGVPAPADIASWRTANAERLASYIDEASRRSNAHASEGATIDAAITRFDVPLTDEDLGSIRRFRRTFVDGGLALKFQTFGRPPQSSYPTYRDLLVQTDPQGRQRSFLASEDDYAFVRSLETRDLVIPVVGDLSGPSALAAIGHLMTERHERLGAFYASNVESYLFGSGKFDAFVRNLARLPRTPESVIIRSVFGVYGPQGRGSTSVVQRVGELVEAHAAGHIRSYGDLIP